MENRKGLIMKKDTLTFYHDYYARHDEKILCLRAKFGIAGYGTFWVIIEMLWEHDTSRLRHKLISGMAFQNNIDITMLNDVITECISLELLNSDGEYFWSEAVSRRKQERDQVRAKYSAAGKKGMKNRYEAAKNSEKGNDVITMLNDVITMPNKKKESKDKDYTKNNSIVRDLNISFDEFWEHYDKKTGDKKKLIAKWQALKDDERILAMEHIKKYKIAQPDKSFRKDPQTYLNNKSFNDEIIYRNSGVKNEQQPTERLYTKQEQEQRAKLFAAGFKPSAA